MSKRKFWRQETQSALRLKPNSILTLSSTFSTPSCYSLTGFMLKMDEHTKVNRRNPTSREVVVSHTADVQNNAPMDDTALTTRFYFVDSTPPITPSSSTDSVEEASPPSRRVSKGPLYELSELMVQLPLKRGLSKYFQGKSQSFKTLSSVRSIEDLAKRENPPRKKLKICMNDEVD